MPEDRRKAHELFQAWEEQCASESAGAGGEGGGGEGREGGGGGESAEGAPGRGDKDIERSQGTLSRAALLPPSGLDEADGAQNRGHEDTKLRTQVIAWKGKEGEVECGRVFPRAACSRERPAARETEGGGRERKGEEGKEEGERKGDA